MENLSVSKMTRQIEAGAIIFQKGDRPKEWQVIVYTSKKFSEMQKQYCGRMKMFIYNLLWTFYRQRALTWLHMAKDMNFKLTRGLLKLVNLDFHTTHKTGGKNEAPGMLSCNPTESPRVDKDRL